MIERFNQTLRESIAKLSQDGKREQDQYVDTTLFVYRSKTHKITGYSPFYLIYKRQVTLPVELKIPSGRAETNNVEDVLME